MAEEILDLHSLGATPMGSTAREKMADGLECTRGGRFRRFLYLQSMVSAARRAGMDNSFRCFGAARRRWALGLAAPVANFVVALRHDRFTCFECSGLLRVRSLSISARAFAGAVCRGGNRRIPNACPNSGDTLIDCRWCRVACNLGDRKLANLWFSRTGFRWV